MTVGRIEKFLSRSGVKVKVKVIGNRLIASMSKVFQHSCCS